MRRGDEGLPAGEGRPGRGSLARRAVARAEGQAPPGLLFQVPWYDAASG
ncbi:MAG TPA: hypothetical protein VF794_35385 [Archangium sp.]